MEMEIENPVLEIKNLTRKRKGFALKDINLSLESGFILGIVGKNGAGKTTLMEALYDPRVISQGEVYIAGVDARKNPVKAKENIGLLSAEQEFLWEKTLLENAELLGTFYEEFSIDEFLNYLKQFEVGDYYKYAELSTGMRMKFQLAFALAHHPKLLLMDEATGGLDVVFRREFYYLLQEAVEKQLLSVVIATHVTEDLDKIADYVACINGGTLVFCESKEELYESYLKKKITEGMTREGARRMGNPRLEDIIYEYGR